MKIYILLQDTNCGQFFKAFKTKASAERCLENIFLEYPEHMRSVEALADRDIYLSIDECSLED
jgi:hypothetical protein